MASVTGLNSGAAPDTETRRRVTVRANLVSCAVALEKISNFLDLLRSRVQRQADEQTAGSAARKWMQSFSSTYFSSSARYAFDLLAH